MFGSKRSTSSTHGVETLIARNTAIEGTVKFTGALTIEGKVKGDVVSESDKDSVVRITSEGRVSGELRSQDVIINGHVKGDVYAIGHLVLASDAVVDGNVHYNLIKMEKGAQINGNMVHSSPSQASGSEAGFREAKQIKPDDAAKQHELAAG
jgi:cytoskeletal protein CcmA (bactofilin family)